MWWRWWWWSRENNWNEVVVVGKQLKCGVGGLGGGKQLNFMAWKPIYMSNILPLSESTFCSWGVDMSRFCSVCEKSLSRKDSMQRHVMSKLRNAGLTPFKTVPMFSFHRNVSGFASRILSPPWLPEWLGPEKRPGFDLYCNKLQRPFTLPRRGSFGVIHNGSLHIHKC